MRKQLYQFLITLLQGIKDDKQVSLIKHIDLWNMNVEFADLGEIFQTPAVFIEFGEISYESFRSSGGTSQRGELTVSLHIVTRALASSSSHSSNQAIALEFFDLVDKVHAALDAKSAPGIGALRRITSVTNHNHGELLETIEIYTASVKDSSAR
jgi:hypothetical protein